MLIVIAWSFIRTVGHASVRARAPAREACVSPATEPQPFGRAFLSHRCRTGAERSHPDPRSIRPGSFPHETGSQPCLRWPWSGCSTMRSHRAWQPPSGPLGSADLVSLYPRRHWVEGLRGARSLLLSAHRESWSLLVATHFARRQDADARGFLLRSRFGRLRPYGGEALRHTSPVSPWLRWSVSLPGRQHPNTGARSSRLQGRLSPDGGPAGGWRAIPRPHRD